MFSCLIFWMILSFEKTDALSNVKVINLPNGVNMTATYVSFKKHENVMIYGNSFKGLHVQSKAQCASECMAKNCNSFGTFKNKPPPLYCWLFKGNLDTNHYYAHGQNLYEVYEVQNTCTKNPLICEHGSVCIPNFNNNTYYCRWCFPPYYGKHCNLTAEEVHNKTIPEDIRTGKNVSCKSLRKNFGVKSYGVYDTYPWRDWRKVTVTCSGGYTMITRISADVNGTINHTISTITQLSDMQGERFRFSTTALNVLYKLIRYIFT
ncbi:uncharacterized protein LOC130636282 [Hydractinia symbiolongicarpus]|uniref:uncharacterized protein LOC130636282 n=1 Tax=Hydractinia symbiolongicarpus TaxID=13093 RepID=UPI00254BF0E4|nr:uncharacterized protein LOC130636282 [Hydractinia symbiolongicarpus]